LERNGILDQTQRNQIANYALVEWNDNINISDSHPKDYLPKYLSRLTQEEKDKMYYWHALPQNWEDLKYDDFLNERRRLISKVIFDGYCKIAE